MSDAHLAVIDTRVAFERAGLAAPLSIRVDSETYWRLRSSLAAMARYATEGDGALLVDGIRIEEDPTR